MSVGITMLKNAYRAQRLDRCDCISCKPETTEALRRENERLREALRDTTVHLSAAVDLLKRGGRKATASDKMFGQMLDDYTNSFERGRAALQREET